MNLEKLKLNLIKNDFMAFDFDEDINDEFYPAISDAKIRDIVRQYNLPDGIFKQSCNFKEVITSLDDDYNAMTEIVAQTCTARFHRHKGSLDCNEKSTLTLYELEKLFELPEEPEPNCINLNHTFRNQFTAEINQNILNKERYDAIFEGNKFFIYITHENDENLTINSNGWQTPTPIHKSWVLYCLTWELHDRRPEENQYLEYAATMMERIGSKPILVFHAKDKIERGNYMFKAREVYKSLNQKCYDFPVLLEFQGVYNASQSCSNEIITISKIGYTHILY